MIPIHLDRETQKPLYAQIRDALKQAMRSDSLKPGDQLPTVAALAASLGVTQTTVRRAYEDLTKDRSVFCHVGRGTFVCDPQAQEKETEPARAPAEPLDPEFRRAARRLRMGIAKSLDNLLALQQKPGLIQFTSGSPPAEILPEGFLEEPVLQALREVPEVYRACGEFSGLYGLRQVLAERFSRSGRRVTPDMVLITSGSQQALSLVAQSLLGGDRRIVCETPCYTGVPNAFEALGHWVESVPRDQEGPLPERLARFAGGGRVLLYLCPFLHNPMGTDLSPARRRVVLDWAGENDALLLSDEIFQDLRFEGPPPPSLLAEYGPERTIMVGSLSKSFFSGLRIGWLVSDPERVRGLGALKKTADLGCPPLMQGLALVLLESGQYDAHVDKVREIYRRRRDAAVSALARHMPAGVSWTEPAGGFNMWVELPAGFSSIALYFLALEQGVSFIPGPYMDLDHRYVNAFRLSYGGVEVEQIQEGVELLALAVKALLKQAPGDPGLGGLGDFL
ncbi:MAG: PLP-dependent aminotransferase family protein [Thermodesulfobacteriota bacterium]